MDRLTNEQLFSALSTAQWTRDDLARLREWVAGIRDPGECLAMIEAAAQGRGCPHCRCARTHRCGRASGLQRFRCLECHKTYNALTGTPLARLRLRGHWLTYLQCVLDSRTVRAAATITGVHRTTSFRWRHRFVPGVMRDRLATLSDIAEADETYLLESQKGSRRMTRPARRRGGVAPYRGIGYAHDCVLVACDRCGGALDFHTGRGPVSAAQLASSLGPVVATGALLMSDGAAAYRRFAEDKGIRHAWVDLRAGARKRGDVHIQHVNGWHARFKGWLTQFRGVASCYLAHYSGWQRVLDTATLVTPAQLLVVAARTG
jgi:transposase-like protein